MNRIIPDFSKTKILVVGDLMLDRYWSGDAGRISPEAPVPIVCVESVEERPGGAGNVARSITALGAQCTLVGLVGNDSYGKRLEKLLLDDQIFLQCVKDDAGETVTKLRVMSRHQQLIRLDFESNFSGQSIDKIEEKTSELISNHDVMVLSDYGKGVLSDVNKLIQLSKEKKVPIFVDPKGNEFSKYRGATAITPNQSEFFAIVGECNTENDVAIKGNNLINSLELEALIITRSEKGVTLLRKNSEPINFPARAKEVFDVTGAGDTFISVVATSYAAGIPLEDAANIANVAASVVVGKLGAAVVSKSELENELFRNGNLNSKIINKENLLNKVSKLRKKGKKVVMTNGCFDILHPGHIEYLASARELGDCLIVAVNTDESVIRIKGASRPINILKDRLTVLSGLQSVDWLISFDEDTPSNLISELLPEILVKGGDYEIDEVEGGKVVRENGGVVKILEYLSMHSTTDLISRIKNDKN